MVFICFFRLQFLAAQSFLVLPSFVFVFVLFALVVFNKTTENETTRGCRKEDFQLGGRSWSGLCGSRVQSHPGSRIITPPPPQSSQFLFWGPRILFASLGSIDSPPHSHEGNVIFKSSSLEFLGPPLAQAVSVQTVSSFSPAILSRPLAE